MVLLGHNIPNWLQAGSHDRLANRSAGYESGVCGTGRSQEGPGEWSTSMRSVFQLSFLMFWFLKGTNLLLIFPEVGSSSEQIIVSFSVCFWMASVTKYKLLHVF